MCRWGYIVNMSFEIGEYVVYDSGEICRIDEMVQRCFDGIEVKDYYKLVPVYLKGSTFYIPADDYEGRVRSLLSKEEIYALIDEMPDVQTKWYDDKNQRKNKFLDVLHGDNYHELISMIRSIYIQKEEQNRKGKKLNSYDERAMLEAEKMINHEFAFVLGINEKDVEGFIKSRIIQKNK